MIIRSAISRVSLAVLVLGVVVACGDDESAATPPASTEEDAAVPPKPDAGADAATDVTTTEEVMTSETPEPDAAVVEAGPGTTGPVATSADVPDATPGSNAPDAAAGDAGETDGGSAGTGESTPDGGDTGGVCEGSQSANDYAVCDTRMAEWCGDTYAYIDCLQWSASRDAVVFDAALDCMSEAFDNGNACDDPEGKRAACKASSDALACVEHYDGCDIYNTCEEYSVEECDAYVAPFNRDYLDTFSESGGFVCPYPPQLGE